MKTTATQEFLDSNAIDGPLTPEQAAALMGLSAQGDTGASATETGAAPAGTTATEDATTTTVLPDDKTNAATTAGAGASTTAATPTLLAKDGVHTIPYDKLVEARNGEQHWKALAESAQAERDALKLAAQARVDAGAAPTKTDNLVAAADAAIAAGADASLFGDFSEEALTKGINTLVDQRVSAAVGKALEPLQQREATSAVNSHYAAILEKHPDAASVFESTELENWIKGHPTYAQPGIRLALEKGGTADVIEVFDKFKEATGTKTATAAVVDPKAAATAVIGATTTPVPTSLSGIPGGRAGGTTVHDQMDVLDATNLGAAMSGMTPAQIDAFLNRQL